MAADKRKAEADIAEATAEVSPSKKAAVAPDDAAPASDKVAAPAAAAVPQPQQQEEVVGPQLCLRVKKLSEKAVVPSRGSSGAAGYDLSSAYDVTVPARGKAMAKTDLSIAIPEGTYARVAPRSGLAWKHSIDVGAGVVDYDYRGNVGVILFNLSDTDFHVKAGDRVAQLILERIVTPPVLELDELDDTARGAGGFGSTGVALKSAEVAQNAQNVQNVQDAQDVQDSERGEGGNR